MIARKVPVKRRGRPKLPPAERKTNNLTFRTRGDLRNMLATSAKEHSRSISEEVELRLSESFLAEKRGEELPAALAGGPDLGQLMSAIGGAVKYVRRLAGGTHRDNPKAAELMRRVSLKLVEAQYGRWTQPLPQADLERLENDATLIFEALAPELRRDRRDDPRGG